MLEEPKRVYAYRDIGPKLGVGTKWDPRVVECSDSKDPTAGQRSRYVVKYRRANPDDNRVRPSSAAMCINEIIGGGACALLSVPTAEPAVVYASEELARSYGGQMEYSVVDGDHFGSKELSNAIPRQSVALSELSDPKVLIDIWAMDCWLMNRDRSTWGNLLYEPHGTKLRVIAVDHGECLAGADTLVGGTSLAVLSGASPVCYPVDFLEQILSGEGGAAHLRAAMEAIKQRAKSIGSILAWVPEEWWEEAGLAPGDVEQCLKVRASNIEKICDLEKWECVEDATSGGEQIRLL